MAFAETPMALPPLARQRGDRSPTGDVLRRRAQPRASTFGVSRADLGRDVLRDRRDGAGRPQTTGGRRAAGTPCGQPIGIDLPVPKRRMTSRRLPTLCRPHNSCAATATATRTRPRPIPRWLTRTEDRTRGSSVGCGVHIGENSRAEIQNVQEDSSITTHASRSRKRRDEQSLRAAGG